MTTAQTEHGKEVKPFCPHGHKACQYEKGGVIHRCRKYVKVLGKTPDGKQIDEHWNCADVWGIEFISENSQRVDGLQAAMESFRNIIDRAGDKIMSSIMNLSMNLPKFTEELKQLQANIKQPETIDIGQKP